MPKEPYSLRLPDVQTTPVVFASPHSGRDYPWAFLKATRLDERAIRSSEDAFVDILFSDAPMLGAPILTANAPRAFVDLNRAKEELDPALIEGVRKTAHNPRVISGLGVIPRVVSNGRAIYRGKISMEEAQARIDGFWSPYHMRLQQLLDDTRAAHGQAILIDCHSMPHEAIEGSVGRGEALPEIVIGDRFGAAANPAYVKKVEAAFRAAGLNVARNAPFAGAYTAQHYGRPSSGQQVIQVEIDRSIYMNEKLVRPNSNFSEFKATVARVMVELAQIGRKDLPVAAE